MFGQDELSQQLKQLESPDWTVRRKGIASIGEMARNGKDARRAIPKLMDIAHFDSHAWNRAYALNAINPMLQSDYPFRFVPDSGFIWSMSECLLSGHENADGVNDEVVPGFGTQLNDIRRYAAANLIALAGITSPANVLDALGACMRSHPAGAIAARKSIDYVHTHVRA
jgi:hypothetical protein